MYLKYPLKKIRQFKVFGFFHGQFKVFGFFHEYLQDSVFFHTQPKFLGFYLDSSKCLVFFMDFGFYFGTQKNENWIVGALGQAIRLSFHQLRNNTNLLYLVYSTFFVFYILNIVQIERPTLIFKSVMLRLDYD